MKRFCIHAVLALAAVLALSAGVGVATGAIPSTSDGTISACQAKIGGIRYLRPIDKQAGEACKASEKAVNWNQKGPKGDPGPQGPAGPRGSGVGAIVQKSGSRNVEPGKIAGATATCPAGTHAISGGYIILGDRTSLSVVADVALEDLSGWEVDAQNNGSAPQLLVASANCVA